MMRILISSVLLFVAGALPVSSQDFAVGAWKSYTNMRDIRGGERIGSFVYGASGGGLFRYDPDAQAFDVTTNAEGLATNDLTALGSDGAQGVWIGGAEGEVTVLNTVDGTMRNILDIAQSTRLQKNIRSFTVKGDTVFIVTSFGVTVFRTDKWEFGDTYENFSIPVTPGVRDAQVFGDSLWVATSSGLLVGWLGSTNLSAPSSWSLVTNALPSTNIRALEVHNDTLYIGTTNGISINGGGGTQIVSVHDGRDVLRFVSESARLLILDGQGGQSAVYGLQFSDDPGLQIGPTYQGIAGDIVSDENDGRIWLMTQNAGMQVLSAGSWTAQNPDAPGISVFYQIAVDADGSVWGGSGINAGGQGFTRFAGHDETGKQWKTFTVTTDPLLGSNDYYKVSTVSGGSVWVSSWGFGVVEVRGDSVIRKIDTQTIPALASSVPSSQTFAVIGSVSKDADGTIWMVNRTAVNGNVLAKLLPDGSMQYEQNQLPGGEGRFTSMVIDRNGTKWLANSEPTAKASTGLYYFNEDLTVDGTSGTGGWGLLTSNDGLPNNTVISLAVDNDGDVWVGTDLGVSIITNPRSPRSRRLSSFPLREQSIQSIAVDAINRKWVGTKEGVFVVSSDGSRLLEHYTVSGTNGAMIDDDVRSIAIDGQRGIVYMGTEKGLSALWIAAVETERSYTQLSIAPNPYLIPGSSSLAIRNLVENSTIKILTVDGRKVTEFDAQGGGRAFWDGRDELGGYVASGVYIIVAFAENGEQVTHGKVIVVRQ